MFLSILIYVFSHYEHIRIIKITDILKIKGLFYPLLHIVRKSVRNTKISIPKLEWIMEKISYKRRVYESVDDRTPLRLSLKNQCKEDLSTMGK